MFERSELRLPRTQSLILHSRKHDIWKTHSQEVIPSSPSDGESTDNQRLDGLAINALSIDLCYMRLARNRSQATLPNKGFEHLGHSPVLRIHRRASAHDVNNGITNDREVD